MAEGAVYINGKLTSGPAIEEDKTPRTGKYSNGPATGPTEPKGGDVSPSSPAGK